MKNAVRNNGKGIELWLMAGLMSLLNTIMFHYPFFHYVANHVENGANGTLIIISLALIMLAANYLAFYLLLWTGRTAGKVLCGLLFAGNALSLFYINSYDVMLDDTMMGNVFNTNFAEASSFCSPTMLLYVLLLGVLPCVLILLVRINYGKAAGFFANIGASLLLIIAVAFANMSNWMWIDRNSTVIGSLLLPWSYIVNSVRYHNRQMERNREEILLPDAHIADSSRSVVALIIGESARRDHFSLYGYERETNPLLAARKGVKAYKANSAATYTTAGVKAILDHKETDKLYEILPNYLSRTGAEVIWRTSNWGQPPLHIGHQYGVDELAVTYPECDRRYDGLLACGLKEAIGGCGRNKVLVVLHTSISHGPLYCEKYPVEFERFTPVSRTVEMSKADRQEVFNSYDNSILYSDWVIDRVCSELEELEGWEKCMIYVSDHGESLGENGLYMHGVPIAIAPPEQFEIPFIVWVSDSSVELKDIETVSQYHVFHSVLHFLGMESPVYNAEKDIFENRQ